MLAKLVLLPLIQVAFTGFSVKPAFQFAARLLVSFLGMKLKF